MRILNFQRMVAFERGGETWIAAFEGHRAPWQVILQLQSRIGMTGVKLMHMST